MPAEKAGYIASISVARVRRRSIAELLSNVDRDLGRGSFLGHLVQLGDLLPQGPRLAVLAAGDAKGVVMSHSVRPGSRQDALSAHC